MGDHGRPLERLIERQRHELGENMESLAEKARAVTDWRAQFDARPFQLMGLAAGSGALLALLTGRRRARRLPREPMRGAVTQALRHRSATALLARDIQSAVGGVAATAAIDFLSDAIPRFRDHFRRNGESVREPAVRPPP